jgi:dTDP-4-dehydrorhamnose reductase
VSNVILTDKRDDYNLETINSGPFQKVDVLNPKELAEIVKKNNVKTIYHLAALLSKACEDSPDLAWNINING